MEKLLSAEATCGNVPMINNLLIVGNISEEQLSSDKYKINYVKFHCFGYLMDIYFYKKKKN